ncbi:hypothetical protein SLEP1_g54315 [Rubroshorea leprosula]|uniref:Uncharacterized protein n=1 Tax=Rubroshorea leprosula TaxID=152421 RepID=A0AAV5MEY9_9ROSI|nr:hypothetical protein SLEP1_g54315 [Rubroshorea leprosula]
MEDPAAEWEIQESSPERDGGKLGWILNKGLVLGKKMVITGLVISSASLILPPVVVISAIGFVCSVPYGVFLASYACTEKLMSMLLPCPATGQAFLKYGTIFDDGEEFDADENQGESGWFNENSFVQKEGGGLGDDAVEEIGMRIDLNGKRTSGLDEGGILEYSHRKDSSGKDTKEVTKEVYATAEENRNERHVHSFLDEEREKPPTDIDNRAGEEVKFKRYSDMEKECEKLREDTMEEVEMRIELVDEGKREFAENDLEDTCEEGGIQKDDTMKKNDDGEDKGQFLGEVKELSKDIECEVTTEWIEKEPITEERSGAEPVDVDEISGIMAFSEGVGESSSNIGKKRPVEAKNLTVQVFRDMDAGEVEEVVRETKGVSEKIRDKGKIYCSVEDKQNVETEIAGAEQDFKVARNLEESGSGFEKKFVLGNVETSRPMIEFEQKIENDTDEQTPEISKELQEIGSTGNMDLVPKEMKLGENIAGSKQKDVKNILTTIDLVEGMGKTISDGRGAKERQEPRIDSAVSTQEADYIAINAQQDSQVNWEKGTMISSNEDAKETILEGGLDLWEHEKAVSQSYSYLDNDNYDGSQQSPGHLDHHQCSDFVDHTQFSRKDLATALDKEHREEKIWQQMNAIRKIVGYKGSPEQTCIEELKALYLFTGVEPPASLNNHSDLVEVNNMLHFLMSILGVK